MDIQLSLKVSLIFLRSKPKNILKTPIIMNAKAVL